jgi:hypothetical protein
MALSVLDGNQSATTLSSVVTGGEHIVAHSVVSLGSNAISNITTAVSGSVVTIPNLNVLARSVATEGIADSTLNFVKIGGHQDGSNQTAHIVHVSGGGAMKVDASDSTVTFGAISGTVTIGNTVTIAGTVTANPTGTQTIAGTVTVGNSISIQSGNITIEEAFGQDSFMPISGTVTANAFGKYVNSSEVLQIPIIYYDESIDSAANQYVVPVQINNSGGMIGAGNPLPISGTVTANLGSALPTGTNRIGVVTIGAGTVTIGAGTAQIGSVTVGNSVTIGSLPALAAGTAQIGVVTIGNIRRTGDGALSQLTTEVGSGALQTVIGAGTSQIGSVTASISNSVTIGSLPAISGTVTANTFALQGTAVTTSNFTSTTASTVLANYNATREVLTIFNEGAGNLHICAGATCTTIAYQVRLSAGDYYEVPNHQTTITHSAVFATAGTARVCQVS